MQIIFRLPFRSADFAHIVWISYFFIVWKANLILHLYWNFFMCFSREFSCRSTNDFVKITIGKIDTLTCHLNSESFFLFWKLKPEKISRNSVLYKAFTNSHFLKFLKIPHNWKKHFLDSKKQSALVNFKWSWKAVANLSKFPTFSPW